MTIKIYYVWFSFHKNALANRWPDVGLKLVDRIRRWPNSKPTSGRSLVFAGKYSARQSQKAVTAYSKSYCLLSLYRTILYSLPNCTPRRIDSPTFYHVTKSEMSHRRYKTIICNGVEDNYILAHIPQSGGNSTRLTDTDRQIFYWYQEKSLHNYLSLKWYNIFTCIYKMVNLLRSHDNWLLLEQIRRQCWYVNIGGFSFCSPLQNYR